jgi:enoyl-CoA hydratase/carnithine racemase
MSFEQITTALEDRVFTITLNRPDRMNAWTLQMGEELRAAFDQVDQDDEVRVVIMTGSRPRVLRRDGPRRWRWHVRRVALRWPDPT